MHCFSCGYHPSNYTPKFVEKEEDHGQKSVLPFDFTREVPTSAWKWLLQYGLGYQYWKAHCGYSPHYKRLVFKVGQPTQFSIGRYIEDDPPSLPRTSGDGVRMGVQREIRPLGAAQESPAKAPRSLQERVPYPSQGGGSQEGRKPRKWHVWGDSHKHAEVVRGESAGFNGTTVLVEDLISAHKVGQVAEAIPLFGVEVHPCHLWHLKNSSDNVVLWLDGDQGDQVAKKANRINLLTGVPVHIITTEQDPKSLPFREIRQHLQKVLDR